MFVEEGFRIRFANGEVIDFYADTAADKESWMKVLADCIGKDLSKARWTELVLAKEGGEKDGKAKEMARREKQVQQQLQLQQQTAQQQQAVQQLQQAREHLQQSQQERHERQQSPRHQRAQPSQGGEKHRSGLPF